MLSIIGTVLLFGCGLFAAEIPWRTVEADGKGAFAPVSWDDATEVRKGVRCLRLAVSRPRLMKVNALRCDLSRFGFAATGRSPDWGRPVVDPATGRTNFVERTQRTATRDWIAARRDVVVAVNASPWEGGVGIGTAGKMSADPSGFCLSDGVLISDNPCWVNVSFVIRRNGRPDVVCSGNAAPSAEARRDFRYAFMCFGCFLKDGAVLGVRDDLHPRTAYGLSRDRRHLYLMTVDGRQEGWSLGADMFDLAQLMLSLGASDGVNMDGGGSCALLYRDPETGRPVQLNRHDAEGRYARPVAINFGLTE